MTTYTKAIDPDRYDDQICRARREIQISWNTSASKAFLEPLPHAHYFGIFSRPDEKLMGFSEWYRYSNLPEGFESSPYGKTIDLPAIGAAEEIANIRTAYLMTEYRKSFGIYVKLYVSTALSALKRGIRFTTLSTATTALQLQSLYLSMGGQLLGHARIRGLSVDVAVFLINLEALVASPVAKRIIARDAETNRPPSGGWFAFGTTNG